MLNIGKPALTIVANCFEKITVSCGVIFFLNKPDPELFFFSFALAATFFIDFVIFVVITFFAFSLLVASFKFAASISPETYLPSDMPL